MASDEYYDAIGEVLAYVLSAEDAIIKQVDVKIGKCFSIRRDSSRLKFYAEPDKRYFQIVHEFSLFNRFLRAYKDDELLRQHMDEFGIEDQLYDDHLKARTAFERVVDISEDDARRVLSDIGSHVFHSDCRIQSIYQNEPDESGEDRRRTWNGVRAVGLLYPYEEDFKPRDYEIVAQQVISVGTQIDEQLIKKLGLEDELETPRDSLI